MRLRLLSGFILLFIVLAPAWSTASVQVGDATFETEWQATTPPLKLSGTGTMYWFLFEVAAGALYLPSGLSYDQWTTDSPKRLELAYFYEVTAEDFIESSWNGLRKNLTQQEIDTFKSQIDQIHKGYKTVAPGDRYALTYVPGRGTELALNGESLVMIEGGGFAAAYFKLWFGDNPLNSRFRQQILEPLQ